MTPEDSDRIASEQDQAPVQPVLDFDSDTPLVCNRDQSGDTTCESCQ